MLCQKCGKNEVEVHFIQTINGEKTELLMCSECAANEGFAFSPISFTNFFQSFFETPIKYSDSEENVVSCTNCGMSLDRIKRIGKAGCPECYGVFRTQLSAIIKNVQAGGVHRGKCPKSAQDLLAKREINALRSKLTAAVEKEEYEEAAAIRDKIKELEGRRENG